MMDLVILKSILGATPNKLRFDLLKHHIIRDAGDGVCFYTLCPNVVEFNKGYVGSGAAYWVANPGTGWETMPQGDWDTFLDGLLAAL